jgi:hypothetical protein
MQQSYKHTVALNSSTSWPQELFSKLEARSLINALMSKEGQQDAAVRDQVRPLHLICQQHTMSTRCTPKSLHQLRRHHRPSVPVVHAGSS